VHVSLRGTFTLSGAQIGTASGEFVIIAVDAMGKPVAANPIRQVAI